MLMVPLCLRCLPIIVVAINQTIKTKLGVSGLSEQLAALATEDFMVKAVERGLSGIIQMPHFTLLSFLQESTVQRLFGIECNTTLTKKVEK